MLYLPPLPITVISWCAPDITVIVYSQYTVYGEELVGHSVSRDGNRKVESPAQDLQNWDSNVTTHRYLSLGASNVYVV